MVLAGSTVIVNLQISLSFAHNTTNSLLVQRTLPISRNFDQYFFCMKEYHQLLRIHQCLGKLYWTLSAFLKSPRIEVNDMLA